MMADVHDARQGEISPVGEKDARQNSIDAPVQPLTKKSRLGAVSTIFACGAALFSDGYVNASSGPVVTVLTYAYPNYADFTGFESRFSSLVFPCESSSSALSRVRRSRSFEPSVGTGSSLTDLMKSRVESDGIEKARVVSGVRGENRFLDEGRTMAESFARRVMS